MLTSYLFLRALSQVCLASPNLIEINTIVFYLVWFSFTNESEPNHKNWQSQTFKYCYQSCFTLTLHKSAMHTNSSFSLSQMFLETSSSLFCMFSQANIGLLQKSKSILSNLCLSVSILTNVGSLRFGSLYANESDSSLTAIKPQEGLFGNPPRPPLVIGLGAVTLAPEWDYCVHNCPTKQPELQYNWRNVDLEKRP